MTSSFVLLKKGRWNVILYSDIKYGLFPSYFLAGVIEYEGVHFNIKI